MVYSSVLVQVDRLIAGEVGYLAASIKSVADARVGDTITSRKNGATQALPGTYPPPPPSPNFRGIMLTGVPCRTRLMLFCSLNDDYILF
jgi:translation elongation factor EF-4